MIEESFSVVPLTDIAPSYLYVQYKWSKDLQAFVDAYNKITQGYLNWFNKTPLAVYTLDTIKGALLDWIGRGIYGYQRPAFIYPPIPGTLYGDYGLLIYAEQVYANAIYKNGNSGSAVYVDDDIYKRALTWHVYKGDGVQMTLPWLKRRVARFVFGNNGKDINIDELYNVSVTFSRDYTYVGAYGTGVPYGTFGYGGSKKSFSNKFLITITLLDSRESRAFKLLFENGFLAKPFQLKFKVILT